MKYFPLNSIIASGYLLTDGRDQSLAVYGQFVPDAALEFMATESGTLQKQSGNVIGDRLVKKSFAAMKLGVSVRTIDRLIQKEILEKVFVGSAPRLRLSQLDGLIERGS